MDIDMAHLLRPHLKPTLWGNIHVAIIDISFTDFTLNHGTLHSVSYVFQGGFELKAELTLSTEVPVDK